MLNLGKLFLRTKIFNNCGNSSEIKNFLQILTRFYLYLFIVFWHGNTVSLIAYILTNLPEVGKAIYFSEHFHK